MDAARARVGAVAVATSDVDAEDRCVNRVCCGALHLVRYMAT